MSTASHSLISTSQNILICDILYNAYRAELSIIIVLLSVKETPRGLFFVEKKTPPGVSSWQRSSLEKGRGRVAELCTT